MPNYKTHLIGGGITFFIVIKGLSSTFAQQLGPEIPYYLVYGAASLIGSIFPDIDIQSKMQRLFYLATTIVLLVALATKYWSLFFGLAGLALLIPLIRHRALTHRVWFLIAIPGMIAMYISYIHQTLFNVVIFTYIFFVAGALSHVFLDSLLTRFRKIFGK